MIQLGLNGSSAPDVAEGNQGYETDALLVKAKLIIPLDKYATKYGWYKHFPPGTMAMFRWTPDGKTYGKGNVWGVAQFGQSVGVFYNTAKLKQYGVDPTKLPTTFSAFDSMLAQLRKKVPSSDPLLVIGNKDGYEALHDFGMVQGAYVPGTSVRNWIFHVPGSTYYTPTNVKALTLFQQWVKNGYFGTTTTPSTRTTPPRSSPRARASSTWAATGRPRSSRPASRATSASWTCRRRRAASTWRSARRAFPGTSRRRRSTRTSARRSSTG